MLYNAPAKGEDGFYFVKALNDSKRKCLVQLNKVNIADISGDVVRVLTLLVSLMVKLQASALRLPRFSILIRKILILIRSSPTRYVTSFLNLLVSGLPRNLLVLRGMLSRSGSTQTQSLTLTQMDMHLLMKLRNKKIVDHI